MDSGKETGYFLQSVRNLFALADKQSAPKFSDFLSEEQQAEAEPLARRLARETGMEILLWGGYEGAVRVMLGVFPDPYPPDPGLFPITGVTARARKADKLEHRAIMGTLLGGQLKREMLGDLIPGEGEAYIFADERVEKALLTQFDRIGGIGVRMEKGTPEIRREDHFEPVRGTLASVRLDAAVAMLAGTGREKAAALIREGLVSVGHIEEKNVSRRLREGDVLVIRRRGKYKLETVGEPTRKGRIPVTFQKYL